jgi:outer membrane protein assembly factor BamB
MDIIAVVPIFVNVGAAVLPTLLTAVTSVAVLMLRPRELVGLVRRRPVAAAILAGAVAMVLVTGILLVTYTRHSRIARAREGAATHLDWAKVAEDLIARQQALQVSGAAAVAQTQGGPEPAPTGSAVQAPDPAAPAAVCQDFSRSLYAGGPSPAGLSSLWSFRPEDTLFLGTPVVAGDRVFAAGCQTDLGGYTGVLACLDRQTGRPIWQITEIKGESLRPFFSSPALTEDGKSLVIGQGLHEDRDCSLLCFDAMTGQLRWAVKTPLHIESSPAIHGDLAVVGAGAVEGKDGRAQGDPGFCLAVRVSDGRQVWREPVNDPESSPAVDADGIVYIGSGLNGCAVVALRSESDEALAAKGLSRIAWRTALTQPITGPITLAGDVVIAGGGNGDMVHSNRNPEGLVVALDRRTGASLWQTRLGDAVLGGVAYAGGVLICPVRTGEVAALSLKDGQRLWSTRVSGDSPVLGGCAFTGTRIYAASSDGFLAAIDPKDGRVLEKLCLNDQAKPGTGLTLASPRVVGGRIIVGSETGGLRCLAGSGGAG